MRWKGRGDLAPTNGVLAPEGGLPKAATMQLISFGAALGSRFGQLGDLFVELERHAPICHPGKEPLRVEAVVECVNDFETTRIRV